MKKIITLLCFAFTLISFSFAQQSQATPAKAGVQYGKKINKEGAISVKELENTFKESTAFTGKVEGEVVQVCKSSGCFLTLKSSGQEEPIMVRFADSKTIMPKDIVGKTVVLEGKGRTKSNSTAITFIADGVLVLK